MGRGRIDVAERICQVGAVRNSLMDHMKDAFAGADVSSYEEDLNRGLRLSGESRDYFAHGRLSLLERQFRAGGHAVPLRILDYGCAAGETTGLLAGRWPGASVTGVDVSDSLIAEAKAHIRRANCSFCTPSGLPAGAEYDLIYCNGVFHHIPPEERAGVLVWLRQRLAADGLFSLWENNCWNPGTRWVMSRVPFDRDAVPLSPFYTLRMLKRAGFTPVAVDFAFIFPKSLRWLRPLEKGLCKLPLGAQYQVLSRHQP